MGEGRSAWRRRARFDPAAWVGVAWGAVALTRARARLKAGSGLRPLAGPSLLPERAWPGTAAVLARRRATCLERALVAQAFEAGRRRRRDVVVGVARSPGGVTAHAWLDGETPGGFKELTRVPPA